VTNRALFRCIVAVALGLFVAVPAHAQGNGRPKNPKEGKPTTPSPAPPPATGTSTTTTTPTTTTPTATTPAPTTPTTPSIATTTTATVPVDAFAGSPSYRQFGSWLEDASAPSRGDGYTNIGFGYWRMSGMSQTNVPMLGAGVGVSDRLGVSATVPFYRTNVAGTSAHGMDDVYLGASYNLFDPTLTVREVGLSIGTVMEVLSAGATDGRTHFAFPVALEIRRQPFRIYGSAGYFTRGAVFSGGALEWAAPRQWIVSGILTQSRSIKADASLDSLAVSRQRSDVMASIAHAIGGAATGYVSVGRSLSSLAEGGTSLALNGGVSVRFSALKATP
jgi:hypothetical protein